MSNKRHNNGRRYSGFEKRGVMDKIGDSMTSVFSRRSRKNDKDDDVLAEFTGRGSDNYELFVDEEAQRKRAIQKQKQKKKTAKKNKPKKPVSPAARRVRNIITSCVIVAVVLIVCVVLSLTVLFKTQEYKVTGSTKYTDEELINTCGIEEGDNIFLASKSAAEERLIEAYPYIEEAEVSFDIPDTITIHVVEGVPAYLVKASESTYLVASAKGRILEKTDKADKYALPLFLCGELKTNDVGGYIEYKDKTTATIIDAVVTVFTDNGYTGITEIDATDTSEITFTYDDRIKVKIGLPEDISYKVRTAMTIIIEKLDLNGTNTTEGELDVSSCNVTKKSYFREQSLIDAQVETTKPIGGTMEDPFGGEDATDNEDGVEETKAPLSPDDWYMD